MQYVEQQHYARSTLFYVLPTASNISQELFVVPSLLPVNTEVNISGRLHSMHQIQLHIRDDNVGLEAVENRTIVLSAIPSQSCHNLQFGNTQILIKDDDSKKLRFTLLTSHLCNNFILGTYLNFQYVKQKSLKLSKSARSDVRIQTCLEPI